MGHVPKLASELTAPFWEAAARHALVRPVCDDCGESFFIPQLACPTCHSISWSYRESSGLGTVVTYSVVHRAPTADHDPPYVVAVIELDERWSMMSNVVDCDVDCVHIGQRVVVTFRERSDGVVLPLFEVQKQKAQ